MTVTFLITLLVAAMTGIQDNAAAARKAFEEGNAAYEKTENDKALAAYEHAIALDSKQPDYHLGRARTLARLQRYADAIAGCSDAIALKADFAAAYLDRGHFRINARQVEQARPDLEKAKALDADAYGVAYHLALANYILGDYEKAVPIYETCVATAKTPENTFACSAWQYVTLRRAGHPDLAAQVLERVTPDVKITGGSAAYLDRLLLFKGAKTEEQVAAGMTDNLQTPTVGYGIGVWHLLNNREAKAREYFERAATPPAQQSAFGSVAAFYELQRMKR